MTDQAQAEAIFLPEGPQAFAFVVECQRATPGKRGWNGRFRVLGPVPGNLSLTRLGWEPKVGKRYTVHMTQDWSRNA